MNFSAGLYRLAQAIKWIGRLLGGSWLVFSYIVLTSESTQRILDGLKRFDPVLLLMLFGAFVLIAITEVIAWVLEGFSSE